MRDRIGLLAIWRLVAQISLFGFAARSSAEEKTTAPKVTFEDHILPILKARCIKCHAGAEPENELRLTTRRDILRGGKSGPAMRIAAAESSLIWEKLASNEMPQGGPPLSAEEKGVIRTWINDGAASTDPAADADDYTGERSGEPASDHWAFRPSVRRSQLFSTVIWCGTRSTHSSSPNWSRTVSASHPRLPAKRSSVDPLMT